MNQTLPLLTDDDRTPSAPPEEAAGFGALSTPKGILPLKAMDVEGRIDGLLTQVTLRQTFVNNLGEPLEATYIFPLPDRAAVTHFTMEVAGRVVEGVLKERGEARRAYDQALQEGHRAAIAEEERPGVFTLRVGNLMPGEEAVIRLELCGQLPYGDGEATFRFPFVVAPRYIPGTPLAGPAVGEGTALDTDAVPDASRITPPVLLPGYPNPVRLSLTLDVIQTGLAAREFRSSLHAVAVEVEKGKVCRISLQPGERLNRDFVLRFRLGGEAVRTALTLRADPEGDGQAGTFLLTALPPTGTGHAPRPRDLVFVLDRSGSMAGWKMVAARRALASMVDTLSDEDRFTIYAFDNTLETPPSFQGGGLTQATFCQRSRALEFLSRIESRGGTEMAQPLERAVRVLSDEDPGRDRFLVLITDGQVGNEDQILRSLGQRVRNLRIFTLGIDQAVNEGFLKRLAALGGGSCELVESEERLEAVMDALHRRIASPELTELHLEPDGFAIEPDSLVPGRMPHLFAGAPLFLWGRYRGPAKGVLLEGTDVRRQKWEATVPASAGDHAAVTALWVRGRLRELEDRYVLGRGDVAQLEKQIVEISLEYRVLCRFTAYVAVDRAEVVNRGGERRRVVQPVETPAGWDAEEECLATGFCAPAPRATAVPPSAAAPAGPVEASFSLEMPLSSSPADYGAPAPPEQSSLRSPATPPAGIRGLAYSRNQQPPSAPSPPKGGSVLRRFLRGIPGMMKSAGVNPPSPPLELTAYRKRALGLLDHLQKGAGAEAEGRLRELGVLAEKLSLLVEDLKSVGAPKALYRPLEKLLEEIRKLLAKDFPFRSKVANLWLKAEEVLRAFVIAETGAGTTAPEPPNQEGREDFWK
jgi:Ca-activated chloride channel family protein